jgi:hypothetical protein
MVSFDESGQVRLKFVTYDKRGGMFDGGRDLGKFEEAPCY